ncbi:MAG: 2OG-Fe(II) oxygenase [Pyrinomonadaceae bacterium]
MVFEQLDLNQPFIFEIDEILNPEECSNWIERIQRAGPEPAPINTPGGTRIVDQIRNNRRVIFDNPEWAEDLFQRVKEQVPREIHGRKLSGINERLRCYEYLPGQRFAPHSDGAFVRDETEQSFYTYIIYLNEGFSGGETCFLVQPEILIQPKIGSGLFFQHPIIHEGVEVITGAKYVVRTDLMYRKE